MADLNPNARDTAKQRRHTQNMPSLEVGRRNIGSAPNATRDDMRTRGMRGRELLHSISMRGIRAFLEALESVTMMIVTGQSTLRVILLPVLHLVDTHHFPHMQSRRNGNMQSRMRILHIRNALSPILHVQSARPNRSIRQTYQVDLGMTVNHTFQSLPGPLLPMLSPLSPVLVIVEMMLPRALHQECTRSPYRLVIMARLCLWQMRQGPRFSNHIMVHTSPFPPCPHRS